MCGIAGIITSSGQPVDPQMLQGMVDRVAHRGPDGEGVFHDGAVGLGHRRLAIIDLTERGAQPMHDPVSRCVIVYNGEIYNYIELRAELQGLGYRFTSQSDTEVILAAYSRWGRDCVRRFNGMWSFALYDPSQRIVFCSRDRYGAKPFYYLNDPSLFAFGSEIRQLLPLSPTREANREVLTDYVCFGIDEFGPDTFFAGIRRLPPSHNLVFRIDEGVFEIKRYGGVAQAPSRTLSQEEATETLRELLTDAVRLRLRSDVPVGTCLSGGLDSSSVTTIAAALGKQDGGKRFPAITAASESPHNDETAYARMVVDNSQLEWHRIVPDFQQFSSHLGEVVRAQEEPFVSPSVCMQFFVMQEAKRKGLRVLLDGQGGDEILLGYERHSGTFIRSVFRHAGLGAALGAMRDFARRIPRLNLFRQLLLIFAFSSVTARWLAHRQRVPGIRSFPSVAHFARRYNRPVKSLFELQQREVEEESIPHLLRYEDKNGMWHSVEARQPFLDYRLVKFALNLSDDAKINQGWTKFTLRQAMAGVLPDEIVWRGDKLGFEAPDDLWLPMLRRPMLDLIANSVVFRHFYGADATRADAERLPQRLVWRFYISAMWEAEFGITAVATAAAPAALPEANSASIRDRDRVLVPA